jgi:hypothetical protein
VPALLLAERIIPMTDAQAVVNLIMGVFAPWLLAVIMQRRWSDEARTIVAALAYIALAVASAVFLSPIDLTDQSWRQIVLTFATIMIPAYYSFKLLWAKTVVPVIEEKTSPGT